MVEFNVFTSLKQHTLEVFNLVFKGLKLPNTLTKEVSNLAFKNLKLALTSLKLVMNRLKLVKHLLEPSRDLTLGLGHGRGRQRGRQRDRQRGRQRDQRRGNVCLRLFLPHRSVSSASVVPGKKKKERKEKMVKCMVR